MNTHSRIALVTGGSRGLGKNMATSLAAKGIDVILTYHSKQAEAEAVAGEVRALGQRAAILQLDTGQTASFDGFIARLKDTLAKQFGTTAFDFLINNAGIGLGGMIGDTTEETFDTLVNVHLKGVFFLTQKALPLMNDGGGIVNLSSGLARFTAPGYSVYGALKGAVETLTRYQASELGKRGIRANVVAPGAIETDFGGGAVRDNPQYNKLIADTTALGRAGLPDDIGGVVAFLCSDEARWINAQRIEVSGGARL